MVSTGGRSRGVPTTTTPAWWPVAQTSLSWRPGCARAVWITRATSGLTTRAGVPTHPKSPCRFCRCCYRNWIDGDPADLRNTELSVFLRGDGLNLDGAQCFFWVHANHTRWHCTAQPLNISNGDWSGEPERLSLSGDEKLWHLSWSGAEEPATLDGALGGAESYGFSFVGFTAEVTGRLCMDQFAIERS